MIQCRIQLLWLAVFALFLMGKKRYSYAKKNKPSLSVWSKLKKQNQSLKRKLLQHKLMLRDLYRINQAQAKRIQALEAKQKPLIAFVERLKKANQTSCLQILNLSPNAKSGWHTIYRKKKPLRVYCDMKTAGGGWTRFMHYSDPDGRTPIKQAVWDKGIQFAADGNIKEWLTKTYTEPSHNSEKKSKFTNAWTMTLASKVQGSLFTHFKYQKPTTPNTHRYQGDSFVYKSVLLPGSVCSSFNDSSAKGRKIWGERLRPKRKNVSWLVMPRRCKPNYSLLAVNFGDPHLGAGRYVQTYIGLVGKYDSDGGSFEFFYREK